MILHHNIDIKQLKSRGYKFGKFFASNYKAYTLTLEASVDITVWVAAKDIQIDRTKDKLDEVISHYKSVRDKLVEQRLADKDRDYFVCYVSSLDLPIVDADKFRAYFMDDELCKEYKNGKFNEFVVSIDTMDKIVSEVEWLIGREIK
jgi:hypothetical protein